MMNINRTFPLVLLLLFSLSAYVNATPSDPCPGNSCAQLIVNHDSNIIEVFIYSNGSAHSGLNPGSNTAYLRYQSVYNSTGDSFTIYSSPFTIYCSGGSGGKDTCYGSAELQPNVTGNTNFKCTSSVTNQTKIYYNNDGGSDATCNSYFPDGRSYKYIYKGGIGGYLYVTHLEVYTLSGGTVIDYPGSNICLIANYSQDASYLYLNRDDPVCAVCSENTFRCVNDTKASEKCISNSWIPYQSCSSGGYSTCGISNYTECPNVTTSSFTYNFAICNSTSDCDSDQICIAGMSISQYTATGHFYEEYNSTLSGGWCAQKIGAECDIDDICADKLCTGKDVTGVGTCVSACKVTSDCGYGSTCVETQSTSFVANYQYSCEGGTCVRGMYPGKYCLSSLGSYCGGNDACYSENCKPLYQTGNTYRCTVPSFTNYCTTFEYACPAGKGCVQQTYSGPINSAQIGYGIRTCVTGKSNGQTCSSNSECSSNNCGNGYCCTLGKVCCSNINQCNSEQTCFTNPNWSGYNFYYSCSDKITSNAYCQEDSDCAVPPCNNHQCSGASIATTLTYNSTPTVITSVPVGYTVNITMHYRTIDGTSISDATCYVYVNGHSTSGSCGSVFQISITNTGSLQVSLSAFKSGYDWAYVQAFTIKGVNIDDLFGNFIGCEQDSDCLSGRCQEMIRGIQYGFSLMPSGSTICNQDSNCPSGRVCVGSVPSGIPCTNNPPVPYVVGYECKQILGDSSSCVFGWNGTSITGECYTSGWCAESATYKMCCADDGSACCDPVRYPRVERAPSTEPLLNLPVCYGNQRSCNMTSATCNLPLKNVGDVCSKSSQDCGFGATCGSIYGVNNDTGICCFGTSGPSATCGNNDLNYSCAPNMHPNLNTFLCVSDIAPTGTFCQNDDWCIRNSSVASKCIASRCETSTCSNPGEVACIRCSDTTETNVLSCLNGTLSVGGCETNTYCKLSGGATGLSPPASGEVSVETIFSQLINLSYYLIVVVVIFFIIALFIAGLHLAYGLIKR